MRFVELVCLMVILGCLIIALSNHDKQLTSLQLQIYDLKSQIELHQTEKALLKAFESKKTIG